MVVNLSSSPDVYEVAALIATKDGISVDIALARLRRAARTAGLTPEQLAGQLVSSLSFHPGLAVQG